MEDFNESFVHWLLDSDDDAAGGLDGDNMALAVDPVLYLYYCLGINLIAGRCYTDVIKITFKRIGWNAKLAVIKVRKGLSIRVGYFKPNDVYKDLIVFCEENEIQYEKTKDYKIIEYMG